MAGVCRGTRAPSLIQAQKVSYSGQLSAECIWEFPSLRCFPGFGETEVMKWGSVLAILGKIILVWIYSPQNRHLKMGAWAMSCCSSSEWNLLLVHPVSCSLFFCMEWKTLSLFWEVPWCSWELKLILWVYGHIWNSPMVLWDAIQTGFSSHTLWVLKFVSLTDIILDPWIIWKCQFSSS